MKHRLSSAYACGFISLALLALLSSLPSVATAQNKNQSLAELVSDLQSASATPNIDAAVSTPESACAYTVGVDASNPSVPKRFHAASISKLFTAMVIMQLRDEGVLSLQDRVGLYEPTFSSSPIRIEHLLTHTSGLRDRQRANGRNTTDQVDAYIASLAKQRVDSSAGTKWRYADAGFNLLGRVIERITGKPFSQVMKNRLLDPLAMANSSFEISKVPAQQRHQAYSKRGKPRAHPWDRAFLPSSGLQTTAADLVAFGNAVLRSSREEPDSIIKVASLKEMTTERLPTAWKGVLQGYGWQLVNTPQGRQWRHAGGEAGFEGLLTLYPMSHVTIAVLGNKKDWPRFELEREIRQRILTSPNLCVVGRGAAL